MIDLSTEQNRALSRFAKAIRPNPYRIDEQEDFVVHIREAIFDVFGVENTRRISGELESGFGAVLIRGLPVDSPLPITPSRGGPLFPEYKQSFVSETVLIGLGLLTGAEPFNFRQEGLGSAPLIDNIVPVRELRYQRGAGGYENDFPFHCESAWHRLRPDYLVLVGIREGAGARTLVFSTTMFRTDEWPLTDLEIEGWFRLRAPDLYLQMEQSGIPLGTARYSFRPPIEKVGEQYHLNINFNGTDCLHESAVRWLARLEHFIEERAVGTIIGAGSALILNNNRTCHTRTGYEPSFDGNDRWFLRGYFKRDLWAFNTFEYVTDDNTISAEDRENLTRLGWMSRSGRLTSVFDCLVRDPTAIKSLPDAFKRLAAIAYFLTPAPGSRIV